MKHCNQQMLRAQQAGTCKRKHMFGELYMSASRLGLPRAYVTILPGTESQSFLYFYCISCPIKVPRCGVLEEPCFKNNLSSENYDLTFGVIRQCGTLFKIIILRVTWADNDHLVYNKETTLVINREEIPTKGTFPYASCLLPLFLFMGTDPSNLKNFKSIYICSDLQDLRITKLR